MTETSVAAVTGPTQVAPKKKSPAGSKVKKAPAAHPTTSVMVTAAIKELKEKKGSSLPAIKKYLTANYKVDSAKLAPFIRKFLKAAVANGSLVQTNGTGASGHFKLAETKKKQPVTKKKSTAKTATKASAQSAGKKRKSVAKKPKSSEPTAKKAKKTAVAAKPKAPKPKKAPTKAAAKKAPAAKAKPPKAKKSPVKKTVAPKKK